MAVLRALLPAVFCTRDKVLRPWEPFDGMRAECMSDILAHFDGAVLSLVVVGQLRSVEPKTDTNVHSTSIRWWSTPHYRSCDGWAVLGLCLQCLGDRHMESARDHSWSRIDRDSLRKAIRVERG